MELKSEWMEQIYNGIEESKIWILLQKNMIKFETLLHQHTLNIIQHKKKARGNLI